MEEKYIFEAGMLKKVKRSGWWTEGITNPESVAEHCFRTAIIAFILAKIEGKSDATANKICTAAVFHDMHETRLSDLNKLTLTYLNDVEKIHKKIEEHQLQNLPSEIRTSISHVLNLSGAEFTLLKDADYLECAFQAKEYAEAGNSGTGKWIDQIAKKLKTKSAKSLISKIKKTSARSWRKQ